MYSQVVVIIAKPLPDDPWPLCFTSGSI